MKPPVKRASQRGLLLVEAVLSAVVIGVGLSFITRGLASQLRALHTVEEYDTLLNLARSTLQELEANGLLDSRRKVPANGHGLFEQPHAQDGTLRTYAWDLKVTSREAPEDLKDSAGESLTSDVVLTVQRHDRPSSTVRLTAVWPSTWMQQ